MTLTPGQAVTIRSGTYHNMRTEYAVRPFGSIWAGPLPVTVESVMPGGEFAVVRIEGEHSKTGITHHVRVAVADLDIPEESKENNQ